MGIPQSCPENSTQEHNTRCGGRRRRGRERGHELVEDSLSWLIIHPGLRWATPPVLARLGERLDWAREMPDISASGQRCR